MRKKVVLITGASSGIGRATAKKFLENGWTVYGTSRNIEQKVVVDYNGINMIRLDVTEDESVKSAIALLLMREGALHALVNNAGNGIAGAVEDTAAAEAAYQFETNFFGVHRVCKEALPLLRETKGVIINLSSVAGVYSIPFQGMYSASKAALEAMTEAMRLEVKPLGVRVCYVQPGDTKTAFTNNRVMAKKTSPQYEARLRDSVERMEKDEQSGSGPEKAADTIYRLALKKNPPVRRTVGTVYKIFVFLGRLLPKRLVEWIIMKLYA